MIDKLKLFKLSPFLKNIFIYAFSDGMSKALSFLIFPIVAYYLSAEDFGRVNNFQVFLRILAPFIGLSTNAYFSVEYYKKQQNAKMIYNQLLYFILFLFFIVSIVVLLSINQISKWSELSNYWILVALITALFVPFKELFLAKIRVQEKAKFFGVFNFLNVLFASLLTILLVVLLKYNWQGRIWSIVFPACLFGLISIFYGKKFIVKFRSIDFTYWKGFLLFGLPLLPHNLALWLKSGFEKLFITDTIGLTDNGIYSFALSVSAIFFLFTTAFFSAFSPYVYRNLSTENPVELNNFKNEIVKKVYYFLGFYLSLLIIGYFVLVYLIKQFYFVKYGESINYLPYLLGYNFFNAIYIALAMFVYYSKKTKFLGVLTMITALLQVVLLVYFIPNFGTIGAPISALIVSVITAIFIYFLSNRSYPMPWFSSKMPAKL